MTVEIAKVIYEGSDTLPECCRVRDCRSNIRIEVCTYPTYEENRAKALDDLDKALHP